MEFMKGDEINLVSLEERLKNNPLFAEFMDFEICKGDSFSDVNYRLPDAYREFLHCSHFGHLHFDHSWDWLMLVVERIEALGFPVTIKGDSCFIDMDDDDFGATQENKRLATWLACLNFIIYWNKYEIK